MRRGKISFTTAHPLLSLLLLIAAQGPASSAQPPPRAAPAAPAGAGPAAPAHSDAETEAVLLGITALPDVVTSIVMSYDPAARIHTRGERIADDEAAWPIDVRTYDEILMATYLEGLSAETRAFLENAGMHSLQLQIAHKPKATILDLKKVLARHYKLPVESLTLLRGGQSLADAVNVQGLGMERIGPLSLVIRR